MLAQVHFKHWREPDLQYLFHLMLTAIHVKNWVKSQAVQWEKLRKWEKLSKLHSDPSFLKGCVSFSYDTSDDFNAANDWGPAFAEFEKTIKKWIFTLNQGHNLSWKYDAIWKSVDMAKYVRASNQKSSSSASNRVKNWVKFKIQKDFNFADTGEQDIKLSLKLLRTSFLAMFFLWHVDWAERTCKGTK